MVDQGKGTNEYGDQGANCECCEHPNWMGCEDSRVNKGEDMIDFEGLGEDPYPKYPKMIMGLSIPKVWLMKIN